LVHISPLESLSAFYGHFSNFVLATTEVDCSDPSFSCSNLPTLGLSLSPDLGLLVFESFKFSVYLGTLCLIALFI
jgi:hypothetical protein